MIKFIDDDQAYLDWIDRNPELFVINAERKPHAAYIRLHRATCQMISGVPANGRHWTKNYLKLVGTREELETWAQESFNVEPWSCPRCI